MKPSENNTNDKIMEVIEALSAENVAARVDQNLDLFLANFKLENNTINNFQEFETSIVDFMNLLYRKGMRVPMTKRELLYSESKAILEKNYITPDGQRGYAVAYQNALEGKNSGIRKVLQVLTESKRRSWREAYIRHILDQIVSPLDWGLMVDFCREFQDRFRHWLNKEYIKMSPEQLALNFEVLVRLVTATIDRIRQYSNKINRAQKGAYPVRMCPYPADIISCDNSSYENCAALNKDINKKQLGSTPNNS